MKLCQQAGCSALAHERFNWPGNGWSLACAGHARRALGVADAMGFMLTVEPLYRCMYCDLRPPRLPPLAFAGVACDECAAELERFCSGLPDPEEQRT